MKIHRKSNAFTLIELLVVIAIIAILAAILFPVFARAREKARQTTCASNEKQMALGFIQYVQDYDEQFPGNYGGGNNENMDPPEGNWGNQIMPYLKSTGIFICPSYVPNRFTGNVQEGSTPTQPYYTYMANLYLGCGQTTGNYGGSGDVVGDPNSVMAVRSQGPFTSTPYGDSGGQCWGLGVNQAKIGLPSNTIMIFEGTSGYDTWDVPPTTTPQLGSWINYSSGDNVSTTYGFQSLNFGDYNLYFVNIHSNGMNIAFVDGHVKWEPAAKLNGYGYVTPFSGLLNGSKNAGTPYSNNGDVDMELRG